MLIPDYPKSKNPLPPHALQVWSESGLQYNYMLYFTEALLN